MKTVILAFVAIIVIAIGADLALEQAGFSSSEAAKGNAVRLDEKGA
ncbi:hypothetical protein [Coralliovum pocilloporae]